MTTDVTLYHGATLPEAVDQVSVDAAETVVALNLGGMLRPFGIQKTAIVFDKQKARRLAFALWEAAKFLPDTDPNTDAAQQPRVE